jgi:hypothetical protein
MRFSVDAKSRNVHVVTMDGDSAAWEQWFLLTGDRHIDSAESDHKLQLKHLREAESRGAGVIDVGDVLDAMQGRDDRRRTKGVGRPDSANAANYLDRIVANAADMLSPYAQRFVVIGRGNHEQSILKHAETDLTERLCERMTHIAGHRVHAGGYGGWVRFVVRWSSKGALGLNLKYFHGAGGGGMMSHGTLATRRMASFIPDADVVVCGHTHDSWLVTLARERLGATGRVYLDEQHHVRVPSYKEEYQDGYDGWHVERGAPPKPLGAWWMRLYWADQSRRIGVDFTRAA